MTYAVSSPCALSISDSGDIMQHRSYTCIFYTTVSPLLSHLPCPDCPDCPDCPACPALNDEVIACWIRPWLSSNLQSYSSVNATLFPKEPLSFFLLQNTLGCLYSTTPHNCKSYNSTFFKCLDIKLTKLFNGIISHSPKQKKCSHCVWLII